MDEDRTAIEELKHEYCYRLDSTDIDGFVDLFTEDARFDIAGIAEGEGHDQLREFITGIADRDLETLAHMVANPVLDIDGDTASGKWYYVVMIESGDGGVEWGQGRYDEEYRRVDGEWRISRITAARRHTVQVK